MTIRMHFRLQMLVSRWLRTPWVYIHTLIKHGTHLDGSLHELNSCLQTCFGAQHFLQGWQLPLHRGCGPCAEPAAVLEQLLDAADRCIEALIHVSCGVCPGGYLLISIAWWLRITEQRPVISCQEAYVDCFLHLELLSQHTGLEDAGKNLFLR